VTYASAGQGSTNHLSAALFEKAAGVKMTHIPYRGGAPAVMDTVAGRTQVLFSAGTQTLPHVQTGKLKLLAVTEEARSPLLPDVPTVAETLPGYELSVWYGAFGPAGMPPELTARLNREINLILKRPDVIKKMADMGVLLTETTPEQFGQILARDADKYGKLIKELGITAE
jgi:tripartite-type tricarboxylate transporter receptor subunit TctC